LFIAHYNDYRYHESLDNVTPADVFYGRQKEILERREQTRKKTIRIRRKMYDNVVDKLNNQVYITINKTVS